MGSRSGRSCGGRGCGGSSAGRARTLRHALQSLSADGDAGELFPFRVLFLHGPGGVGKSTLIKVFADVAETEGARVVRVDARLIPPSRAAILDALGGRIDGHDRPVLLVDTFELLQPLEDWVRDELLISLPDNALVVIAGWHPPGSRWLADPAWRDLLQVVCLRNLTPDDTRAYLAVERIPPQLHGRLQILSATGTRSRCRCWSTPCDDAASLLCPPRCSTRPTSSGH